MPRINRSRSVKDQVGQAHSKDQQRRSGTLACCSSTRVPLPHYARPAGYCSGLRVALVVVAVAHRRLGPSSSATTSTADRALPSPAVRVRCWCRPMTTARLPFESASSPRWETRPRCTAPHNPRRSPRSSPRSSPSSPPRERATSPAPLSPPTADAERSNQTHSHRRTSKQRSHHKEPAHQ